MDSEPNPKPITATARSLSKYFNASQLRADTWNRLQHSVRLLAERSQERRDSELLRAEIKQALDTLSPIEIYWAFPGKETFDEIRVLFDDADYGALSLIIGRIVRSLVSRTYRRHRKDLLGGDESRDDLDEGERLEIDSEDSIARQPYFEVIIVDRQVTRREQAIRKGLHSMRRHEDPFIYEVLFVHSLEDALIAVLLNPQIQSVVIGSFLPLKSHNALEPVRRELHRFDQQKLEDTDPSERGNLLATLIGNLRPEVDVFMVSDGAVEDIAGRCPSNVRRVFYHHEDFFELHLNILRGVKSRYKTPFFTALKEYSKQPTGVFHAMPISRGKSITKSNWIQDMGQFYGMNIFLAETSATSGGLDSLLDPHGTIKDAQERAARAFHAQKTFFATNGTSTCNKIVVQALVQPGDIVLVDRDCHKSHHYGMVLAGAEVVYLDSYPLDKFSMYGAVPLKEIKTRLLELRRAGKLDRVKMLLLTNCTFDGIVYNVSRVMEECLAIKPNLIFLWDEAWFAFAGLAPTYRRRTAMWCARKLRERLRTEEYRKEYEEFQKGFPQEDDEAWLTQRLLPDPDKARLRVYSTQSTHKTLTALRQGSMIHVFDQDFRNKAEDAFHEAYMTHTSTSPNYQILASLDVGRRQAQLEGYELVQKQLEMAMVLRERITNHPLLSKYFRFLTIKDLIPLEFRKSEIESYYDPQEGWTEFWEAWADDEFVLDATRLTLYLGDTGIEGDVFKNEYLMDRHGIQINKTSRNTVLFMTNIGTTRSSVAYLIEVLVSIAQELEERIEAMSRAELANHRKKVHALTEDLPPLPDFSRFHARFRREGSDSTPEGDIRSAYFMAYDDALCDYLPIEDENFDKRISSGEEIVSAMFVIPYPPGFPILVPGQVISREILAFMRALDVKEIHGYRPDLGLRVFIPSALEY